MEFVLSRIGESVGEDILVPFGVYSFLNKNVDSLTPKNLDTLTQNRTIWFKGRLWKPNKLFIGYHPNEFGPNGWLRGYIRNDKISKLGKLCSALGINTTIHTENYLDWLQDIAGELENRSLKDWEVKLIRNAYSKIVSVISTLSDDKLEDLKQKKVLLTSEFQLKHPFECYLLRRSEEALRKKMALAGIVVPVVEAENAEYEKFYLKLGVNDLAYSMSAKRVDTNDTHLDEDLMGKLRSIVPWLDGFEFLSTGVVSDFNLAFSKLQVFRVKQLYVLYSVEGADDIHKGNPIRDSCCFERERENILYLDEDFQLNKNEHLQLLSLNIIRNLSPSIDKATWSLVVPSILVLGQMIGISPHYRKGQPIIAVEPVEPELQKRIEAAKVPKLKEILETEEEPVVKHEPISKDLQDEMLDEEVEAMEEVSSKKPLDVTKMFREKKRIPTVQSKTTITYRVEPKIIAPKNWEPTFLDGEEVYIEPGISPPSIERIKKMRILLRKIVEAMGANPETVNLCVAKLVTDGYNEDGQLFFNVARNDSPFRWFAVVARELAYNHSHLHYPHVRAMVEVMTKGLENIGELLPEFERFEK